jgi:hypothetical protein
MGRRPIPLSRRRTKQYCSLFTEDEATAIEEVIAEGTYISGAELVREAVLAVLRNAGKNLS